MNRKLIEENSDLINRKWHLNDTIMLDGISVIAKKPRETTIDFRPYLNADYLYDVTKGDYELINSIQFFPLNFFQKMKIYKMDQKPEG